MKKVLYFEGAGSNITEEGSNVGNYRIRTAFLDNEGQEIYLELGGTKFEDKKSSLWKWRIDHLFNLSISKDENESRIYTNRGMFTGYTKENITKWINENLNCNFDTIEVLDYMEGYRVHAGYKEGEYHYNLMDNHIINEKRTAAREKAFSKIDQEFRKKLNSKYSKISLLEMNEDNIVIRCHDSEQNLIKAGLTNIDRVQTINVSY